MKITYPYSKIEGWMYQGDLRWLYKMARGMASIVEIGSWKGRSTHALLSGCNGTVTAVDHFKGTPGSAYQGGPHVYEEFMRNVGRFKNLRVLKMDSLEAAKEVGSAEMIFIDGSHSYEAIKNDLEAWAPKATKLICGHDIQQPGVRQAVAENFGNVEIHGQIWYKKLNMENKKLRVYWWRAKNFGDTLGPIILGHFTGRKIEPAGRKETGKMLSVGSIMVALRENDVVWGTGTNRRTRIRAPRGVKFLAVRGPLTRNLIVPANIVPEIYGDPGILLPLIYKPDVQKTHKVGIVPHYVDKPFVKLREGEKMIDIQADWKTVIREILSCEEIIASSLHGLICAEAYGIPARWAIYSSKVRGADLKFNDHFLGTGRPRQQVMKPIPPIENLAERQEKIINALKQWSN
jgi:pyruvyltransferase